MLTDPLLSLPVPTAASQAEVDAGVIETKFVSPKTLSESGLTPAVETALDGKQDARAPLDLVGIKGADIARSATINLDTATGDLVDLTGTATITAFTLAEGQRRLVRFTGVGQITAGASLILPTTGNIVTAAGDYAEVVGYSGGVVRVADYVKKDGRALVEFSPAGAASESDVVVWVDGEPEWAAYLSDEFASPSILFKTRFLVDPVGWGSVDWASRLLIDANGNNAGDWNERFLYASNGTAVVVDWFAGMLNDSAPANDTSINWNLRRLVATSGVDSADWGARQLLDSSGVTSSLMWGDRTLQEATGVTVADWSSQELRDIFTIPSILWHGRQLQDSSGIPSASWDGRILFDTLSNQSVDWAARALYDNTGISSGNWDLRQVYDSFGNTVIDWGLQALGVASNVSLIWTATGGDLMDGSNTVAFWDSDEFKLSTGVALGLGNTAVASGALANTHTLTVQDDNGVTYRLLCLV